MDLYLDQELTFEKLGMEVRLSEDPNDWPRQILDELYRQAPFSSDYAPKVELRQVDADRRYAMGHIELLNQLAINPREDSTPKEMKGTQKVLVPVVVQEGKLTPLDLLMKDGEIEPLTEERLRKAMFRPALFEAIKKRPGDMSMIEQLYPPNREHGGGRGGIGGTERTASAKPEFLMDAILPTIKEAHVSEVTSRLNGDPSLRSSIFSNPSVVPFMSKLAEVGVVGESGHLKKIASSIKPTVIQIQKLASGYRIKTANPEALIPDAQDVDREAAVGALGGDLVSRVEQDGTTTITTQPAVKKSLEDLEISVVRSFGLYKVRTAGGDKEMVGWVFPKVMAFTGEVLPMAVFSNGSESAMQENIAGVPVARQTDVLDAKPQGLGCFYHATSSGAQALVPLTVKSATSTPDGEGYLCETVLGEQCTVKKVPGLKTVEQVSEGCYGVPEDIGFMPLPNKVGLSSSPDDFTKTAQAQALPNAVRVITDGNLYTFQGQEIDKLAGVMATQFLNKDDAVFLGAVLGQDPEGFSNDLVGMRKQASNEIWISANPVETFKSKYAGGVTRGRDLLDKLPALRTDLLKEAAPMEDPTSVDKILSVGFINPENIAIFASYVPEIEMAIKKLAELLMASRLGLSAVDQGAIQKSLMHLDKVVAGLKTLGATPQA